MNAQAPTKTPQILIVEDQAIVALTIERQLHQLGYQVVDTVAYGEEAIQKTETLCPDLILMDIKLQGDMDGVEAAKQIHARWNTPVIYITAHTDEETLQRAKVSAPFGYLLKPFKERELEIAIEIALRQHRLETRLRESEDRFRRLFEQSNDAIFIYDLEGRLLDVNQQACDMLGYPREQLMAMHLPDLHPPEELNTARDTLQAIRERGKLRFESRLKRADDVEIEVEISARVTDPKKGIVQSIARDITARKWAAAMLRQHNRQLALLNQAGQAFRASLDLDRVLLTVLEKTRHLLDVTACSIWLNDPETDELVCRHATGPQSELVKGWRLAPGEGLAGWVVESGESLIVPDAQADERHIKRVERETGLPIRAILTVPLNVKADTIGVLQLVDTDAATFDAGDLALLEPLAASAAIAVDNARLFEQAQQEIAERKRAEEALRESEERYRTIFETAAVSIWEEDFSVAKAALDELQDKLGRSQNGTDLRRYLEEHPEFLHQATQMIQVLDVNQATLEMFGAESKGEMLGALDQVILPETQDVLREELIAIAEGRTNFKGETVNRTLQGEKRNVLVTMTIPPDPEKLEHVLVCLIDITDRVQAEQSLQAREATLRSIFRAAPIGIGLVTDRELLQVNERICEMVGRTREELLGKNARILYPSEEDYEYVGREKYAQIEKYDTGTVETRWQHKDGTIIDVLLSSTPINPETSSSNVTFTALDITQWKRAQEALRQSEASLAAAQRIAHVGNWEWNVKSDRMHWSDELYRIYGYEPGQSPITSDMALDPIHPDDIDRVLETLTEALNQATPYRLEYRITLPNSEVRHIYVIAQVETNETGKIIRLHGTAQDVTARKQAQAEQERLLAQIQAQAQRLQNVMDAVPEGVLLLDRQHRVILANPVAQRDLATLAQAGLDDTLTHLGDVPLTELLTSPPEGLWHEIRVKNRTFEIIARSIEAGPNPGGWVLVTHDATQERAIQKRVRRQERLASVGQLAAGIAHDFNNIMAVISLYAKTLLRNPDLAEHTTRRLEIIDEQAWRASELIQQILDFSRHSVLERQPMDLLVFIKEQIKMLKRTLPENIEISFSYQGNEADTPYTVNADPTRLQQAVMNLVVNARDAMPEGGELNVHLARLKIEDLKQTPLPEMATITPPVEEWIRLTVSDTGIGIPPDVRPHIFDPFFTTKASGKGTGLGLAQVYGIVGQHEGYIDVESEVGKGATFIIYLPALPIRRPTSPPPSTEKLQLGEGQTILIVEDNDKVRKAIADCLEMLNYRVIEAANGLQALDVIDEADTPITLVLCDVVMPKMGGKALFQTLKQREIDVKMILMTGHPLEDELQELKKQGLDSWIAKPPNLEQLGQLIAQVIGEEAQE